MKIRAATLRAMGQAAPYAQSRPLVIETLELGDQDVGTEEAEARGPVGAACLDERRCDLDRRLLDEA